MRRITLEALGLSKKEHIVLNILQQLTMPYKISRIAKQAELAQSTTSFILRKLEQRKLVNKVKYCNHFRWKYRKNLDIIENCSLESFQNSFINVISGMSEITKTFMKILDLTSSERLLSIQGAGISKNILKKIDAKFLSFFHNTVKKRKIIIEGIIAKSVLSLFDKMPIWQISTHIDRLTIVYVLPDEFMDFPLDIFIFRDDILLVDYETERLVHIQDSALSQTFKALFLIAKEYSKKIDLNLFLKNLINKKTQ